MLFTGRRRGRARELGIVAIVAANDFRDERARLDRDRLVHDAALLRVVANLDVADQREVLAERMADESIVGEQAAQVRVAAKHDAEQVESFALEPIGRRPDAGYRV